MEKGHILVDRFQNINVEDICGKALLTAVAIAGEQKFAHRLFECIQDSKLDYDITIVVFSHTPHWDHGAH